MEIILIRHTSPDIEKGICYGQSNIGLKTTFKKEALEVKKKLPACLSDFKVYSSPLERCKKLAEFLFTKIIFDNRLKELNFGDWELKKWNDISKPELNFWMENFVYAKTKNGESYQGLHKRTNEFITEIKKQQTPTVLVTHAGVIRSIWANTNNISLKKSFNLKLDYGAVLKIKI